MHPKKRHLDYVNDNTLQVSDAEAAAALQQMGQMFGIDKVESTPEQKAEMDELGRQWDAVSNRPALRRVMRLLYRKFCKEK